MVRIKVLPKAKAKIHEELVFAKSEYGTLAAKRWNEELDAFYKQVLVYPLSYARESFLSNFMLPYRSAIIRKNFKLIYRFDVKSDIVIVVDLWDMRKDPCNLLRQFNR